MKALLPVLVVLPASIYSLLTAWCGYRFFCRQSETRPFAPSVTILKPVKGADDTSYENFASFCRQDYPASVQIVFAVASLNDPVVAVLHTIQRDFKGTEITIVVDDRTHGPNHKVCNLINAFPTVKHDIIIITDADVRVGPDFLSAVCAPFADEDVGLVTSPYCNPIVDRLPSAIEALGHSCEMMPNVLVAYQLEGLTFALGASMAVRREALEKIGGFTTLVDYLADDYQLGNMIHRAGYRLQLSRYLVETIARRATLSEVLSRQLRWGRTMRVSRCAGYLGLILTHPFSAATLAIAVSGMTSIGFAAAIALYLLRSSVSIMYSRYFLRDNLLPRVLWLLPFRDMIAVILWGLSFFGNRVHWRGHTYRLIADGKMEEV